MTRILVVDDEQDLCEILSFNFEAEGYAVDCAYSAEEALEKFSPGAGGYSLILLDVMMDRMSGFDMARQLRSKGIDTPIIFLTASDDYAKGFASGADDYITKPFSFDNVLLRVKAVLRRTESAGTRQPGNVSDAYPGLTRREAAILDLLAAHRGRYFSRADILAAVWPDDTYVTDRSVDVHIARLRKKLGADGPQIVNKIGIGYAII